MEIRGWFQETLKQAVYIIIIIIQTVAVRTVGRFCIHLDIMQYFNDYGLQFADQLYNFL